MGASEQGLEGLLLPVLVRHAGDKIAGATRLKRYTGQMRVSILLLLCVAAALHAESVAGLKWTAPSSWSNKGSAPMRAATYMVPPAPGDKESSECVVYFFGTGQGGSVEANVDRWKGQFTQAGRTAPAQIQKRSVHGLPLTTIDTSGDYSGMGGPLAGKPTVEAGYRLLGAIFEGPEGNVFIKFAGPAKTVAANQRNFEQLVNSFDKEKK